MPARNVPIICGAFSPSEILEADEAGAAAVSIGGNLISEPAVAAGDWMQMTPADLHAGIFTGTQLLHVTGITPALSAGCAATVTRAIELAHAAGALVSFDPNYRPTLGNAATAQQALLPLMAAVDLLLMSHEDSRVLLGIDDAEQALITQMREEQLSCIIRCTLTPGMFRMKHHKHFVPLCVIR